MTLRNPACSPARACAAACLAACLLGPLAAAADDGAEVRRLMRQGNLPAALQRAETAVAAMPRSADLRFLQGVILTDLHRDAEAFEVFTLLSQEFPALPEPLNNLALLQARAGRWEAARVSLEAALRNDPGLRTAQENLGDVHLQLAVLAWAAAASGAVPGDGLQRKLRLGRELLLPAAPGTAPAVPTR